MVSRVYGDCARESPDHIAADMYHDGMDVRAERLASGMSQSQLARAARVSQPNLSAYENGRRTPSAEVLQRIAAALRGRPSERVARHRQEIRTVVAHHHASSPRLVGSIARQEDTPDSDVDLLVDFDAEASLLDEIGLRLALTDLLGVPVDVIAADSLREPVRSRVLAESVEV